MLIEKRLCSQLFCLRDLEIPSSNSDCIHCCLNLFHKRAIQVITIFLASTSSHWCGCGEVSSRAKTMGKSTGLHSDDSFAYLGKVFPIKKLSLKSLWLNFQLKMLMILLLSVAVSSWRECKMFFSFSRRLLSAIWPHLHSTNLLWLMKGQQSLISKNSLRLPR